MKWQGRRQSRNVEDRRGRGGRMIRRAGGGGIGMLVLALVAIYFGVDPSVILDQGGGGSMLQPAGQQQESSYRPSAREQQQAEFVSVVLADTEQTWHKVFQELGGKYEEPKLVLFSGSVQSACGFAQAAMGPFYCPGDHKVYIDLAFFDDLKRSYQAPGDFAQAYVISHEVGHHVQNLLGISDKVQKLQRQLSKEKGNALSVRLELQADCLAGVWANRTDRDLNILEPGDIEEALTAASAVGDDRLQKKARGYVTPESFTHGTSKQRMKWFSKGFKAGRIDACDTFSKAAM
ncbi:MAG TPA: flagellar biosynthesis protein FlgM [Sedimenticola sp.]|nr:flagellar biosynthesis protein FlgM [Sedimenticola sp.]